MSGFRVADSKSVSRRKLRELLPLAPTVEGDQLRLGPELALSDISAWAPHWRHPIALPPNGYLDHPMLDRVHPAATAAAAAGLRPAGASLRPASSPDRASRSATCACRRRKRERE